MKHNIFQDWKANQGNTKGRIILCLFRIASLIRSNIILCVLFFLYLVFYRVFVEWILGIELHWNVKAGKGLRLDHGQASVINGGCIIGENCTIRHCTTIGNKKLIDGTYSASPKLGNNVDIGTNVCIIGDISIGDNVTIGAGSIVTKSLPSNCVAVGNPARIIKHSLSFLEVSN